MQTEYVTVVDPVTLIPTGLAMVIHVLVALLQLGLALSMIVSGVLMALRYESDSRLLRRLRLLSSDGPLLLAALCVALGVMMLVPLWLGSLSLVSLLATLAVAVLLLRVGGQPTPRAGVVGIALVAGFMVWEGEDSLALALGLLSNTSEWRAHEIEWQQRVDVEAPKVGDLAPDFELQDPNGASAVRLSNFRGKRPVVLVFGSYT